MVTKATLLTAALALAGCMTTVVRAAPNPLAPRVTNAKPTGTYLPKGARIQARLDRSIDTVRSRVGDGFNAYLTAPLVASNGRLVAPIGAPIVGHVADLQGGRSPLILLSFDGIETTGGFVPLQVRVVSSQRQVYEDTRTRIAMPPSPMYMDEQVYGPSFTAPYMNSFGPQGGGPGREFVGHPRESVLPSGSTLALALTQPLIVPTAQPARTGGR